MTDVIEMLAPGVSGKRHAADGHLEPCENHVLNIGKRQERVQPFDKQQFMVRRRDRDRPHVIQLYGPYIHHHRIKRDRGMFKGLFDGLSEASDPDVRFMLEGLVVNRHNAS